MDTPPPTSRRVSSNAPAARQTFTGPARRTAKHSPPIPDFLRMAPATIARLTEDNGLLGGLFRGALASKLDFARIINMRTASDFDRAPPGEDELFHLLFEEQGGFTISIANLYNVGFAIVKDVIRYWGETHDKGIKPANYVGDLFGSLPQDAV